MTIPTRGAITRRQMLTRAAGFSALALVQGSLAVPFADAREPLVAERRFRLARANDDAQIASLAARVERFSDEAAAAGAVPAIIANPLDLAEGEWIEVYVTDSEPLARPSGLEWPASFLAFTTVAGAAAFEQHHVLAAMRRAGFVWRLEAAGQDEAVLREVIGELALALGAREIDTFAVTRAVDGRHDGGLWDVLPTPADVPAELSMIEDGPPDG